MVEFDRYVYRFKEFCLTTTVHGFYYIILTKGLIRLIWWLIWFAMFSLILWSCANYIKAYYKFEVEMNVAFRSVEKIDFPSIQICPQFALSKTKVSSMFELLAFVQAFTNRAEDVNDRFKESQKLCNISTIHSFEKNEIAQKLYDDEGLLSVVKHNAWTSYNAVKQCWWDNVEIECNGLLVNLVCDSGPCFAYYPYVLTDAVFQDLSLVEKNLNRSSFKDRVVTFGGQRNGFRILLDVGQHDRCDTSKKFEGTGFTVYVNDHLGILTMTEISSLVMLTPGYEIDVMIRPVYFRRNTRHLGYCRLPDYTIFEKNLYYKPLCYYMCIYKMILDNCNCTMKFTIGYDQEMFGKPLGIDIEQLAKCDIFQLKCVKDQRDVLRSMERILEMCPSCIQPCYESKFELMLTYKKLSKFNSFFRNSSFDEVRKNYILANFYFNSMTAMYVTENQKITVTDVLIYFGAAIGLFLGASYLSLFEIVQLFVHSLLDRIRKIESKHSTQVVQFMKYNKNSQKTNANSKTSNITTQNKVLSKIQLKKANTQNEINVTHVMTVDVEPLKIDENENKEVISHIL